MPDRDLVALSSTLRLSCMRISRRVRFENSGELTPSQFAVLALLDRIGPSTNQRLADHEKVSAPSMLRTTASLVERGLMARGEDPKDKRCVILHLTPEGTDELARTRRHRDEWMLSRLEALEPAERDLLTRAADVLAKVAAE